MERLLRFSLCMLLFLFFACKQTPPADTGVSASIPGVTDSNLSPAIETKASAEVGIDTLEAIEEIIPDYDTMQWSEVIVTDEMVQLDIRYASTNNFTNKQIYDCARCFLRPEVKEQLQKFQDHLLDSFDLGIVLYDCYRPRPYQQKLWDIVPDPRFVGDPAKGSMHNRGMAIDVGLIDRGGNLLDMGTAFDHFGQKSFHSAINISAEAITNRKLLKEEMAKFGFLPITSEW